jgi:hypothetical protein
LERPARALLDANRPDRWRLLRPPVETGRESAWEVGGGVGGS